MQLLVAAVNLCRFAPEGIARFQRPVETRDRNQFRLQAHAKNSRRLLPVDPGKGAATQRPIYMDVAVGHDLGAGVDGGKTDEIATTGVAALATAYGVIHNQTARICGDGLRWRRRLRLRGGVTLLAPQNGKVQCLRQSLVAGRGITQTDREPVGGAQYLQDFGQSQRRFFGYGTQIQDHRRMAMEIGGRWVAPMLFGDALGELLWIIAFQMEDGEGENAP